MGLIVQKYGGTSVGSVERIRTVAQRVAKWKAAGHDVVVVPSAMAGETNRLIALAKQIQAHPDPRELDVVASTGEQVTIGLLVMALLELGVKSRSYAGWQVKILTDKTGARLEAPLLVNTWERDGRGEHLRAVVEAVDPEPLAIDPLTYL